jgi:predicted TIM-barrel fold metal-dependent hydrolase
VTVLDSHQHYGNLVLSAAGGSAATADDGDARRDLDDRTARMAAFGIDAALLMPVNRYLRPGGIADTRAVNDALHAYRSLDPRRFPYAAGIAEPTHGAPARAEIRRLHEDLGFIGISYHARWQGVATDDPWILEQLAMLGELRMIPFIHAHAESQLEAPVKVSNVARAFPDLPCVVTDAMSTTTNFLDYLDIAQRCRNLYFDVSCMLHPLFIKRWVDHLGWDRLMFGTDLYSGGTFYTMNSPSEIRKLELGDAAETAILGGNFRTLLEWTHE